jgi:hypothetical protein
MRIYNGLSIAESAHFPAKNALLLNDIHANFLYSMCCVKRRFVSDFQSLKQSFLNDNVIDELRVSQFIASMCEEPLSFADFIEICALIRYKIVAKSGPASYLIQQLNGYEISLGDVLSRVAQANAGIPPNLLPFSPHSSSYNRRNILSVKSFGQEEELSKQRTFLQSVVDVTSNFQTSFTIPVTSLPPTKIRVLTGRIHGHRALRLLVSALILCQFVLCMVQFEMAHADKSCQHRVVLGDLWLTCSVHSWFQFADINDFDLRFKLTYFFLSFVLLLDITLDFWLQGSKFFKTALGHYKWNKAIQFVAQLSIFIRDIVLLSTPSRASGSFVYQPDFAVFTVIKLLRFWQLNKLLPEIFSTLSLLKKLYPVLKSYFWIVYFLFFTFSILGMSLFSYAVSDLGIALYPTKQQYIDFYNPDYFLSQLYPNNNHPGLFYCNRTDIFGYSEQCGQVQKKKSNTTAFPFHNLSCNIVLAGWSAIAGSCVEHHRPQLPCCCNA